jgi:hypothetical protein
VAEEQGLANTLGKHQHKLVLCHLLNILLSLAVVAAVETKTARVVVVAQVAI